MSRCSISDLHAFSGPFEMVDRAVAGAGGNVQIIAGGDYLLGGCNPVETLELVRARAGAHAVLGNHDEGTLASAGEGGPPYSEASDFVRLSESQIKYLGNFANVLELRWKGLQIRVLHGHRTLEGQPVSWTAKPRETKRYSCPNQGFTARSCGSVLKKGSYRHRPYGLITTGSEPCENCRKLDTRMSS